MKTLSPGYRNFSIGKRIEIGSPQDTKLWVLREFDDEKMKPGKDEDIDQILLG